MHVLDLARPHNNTILPIFCKQQKNWAVFSTRPFRDCNLHCAMITTGNLARRSHRCRNRAYRLACPVVMWSTFVAICFFFLFVRQAIWQRRTEFCASHYFVSSSFLFYIIIEGSELSASLLLLCDHQWTLFEKIFGTSEMHNMNLYDKRIFSSESCMQKIMILIMRDFILELLNIGHVRWPFQFYHHFCEFQ